MMLMINVFMRSITVKRFSVSIAPLAVTERLCALIGVSLD